MDAVWHLADAGVEVRVQTTLTNANENDVLELVEALAFSGITHQTIVPICPIGRATASMMLTPVAYRSFIVRMTEKVKGLRNRGCTVNYQVRPVFGEQDLFADLKTDAFETLSMKYSCEALLNTMEICPDGTVVPCSFLKGGIGNVRDETISGIWSSLEAEKAYLELAGVCRSGACTACPRAGVTCNGGCLANKIALGTPADPYCFARGD